MIELIKGYLPNILDNLPLLPEQASTIAAEVDLLTLAWTAISFVSGTIVVAVALYFGIRYRRRYATQVGGHETHAPAVEIVSMLIPFVACMAMFVWGTKVFVDMRRIPPDAVEYFAFGKQWMWKIQHPNGLREINDFTIPVDTPIKLTMTSEDVIHSFFIPAFRVKQDVLPGRYTTMWFEATELGEFHLFCAEYCGSEHSYMGGTVTVLSQEDYQDFLNQESPERGSPVSGGRELFTSLACVTCHQEADNARGPSLRGVYGREVQLASGTSVVVDDAYLRESIVNPRAKMRSGYMPLMPTFEGQVTEEQLHDLVSYIKTLDNTNDVAANDDDSSDDSHDSETATSVSAGG